MRRPVLPTPTRLVLLAALLVGSPLHAASILYNLEYGQRAEAQVSVSSLEGFDQYVYLYGEFQQPPLAIDTGVQTVSRSYTKDFGAYSVQAAATASVRLVVVPGSGDSVAAWSEGAASIVSGGGCDEWGCDGASGYFQIGSSWLWSFLTLEDIDFVLNVTTERAMVRFWEMAVPVATFSNTNGSLAGRLLANTSYTLEADAFLSSFGPGGDPFVCCDTVSDRFAWSFDFELTPVVVPLPASGPLLLGALALLARRGRRRH